LRLGGKAMVNRLRLEPPVVSLGLFDYPADPVAEMKVKGIAVSAFDAGAIALELGDLRLVNSIMLGAMAEGLPFSAESLKARIVSRFAKKGQKLADLNAAAFERGQAASQGA
jgi:indolepyruvate ferredoxin oxidoreductase beta subunit